MNCVTTLATHLDNRQPNAAKHLQHAGYQTAIVGKWRLGEGAGNRPTGLDYWNILPGQGEYFSPELIPSSGRKIEAGDATDIITDYCLDWLKARDESNPLFLMCHDKAPHRSFEPHPRFEPLFEGDDVKMPDTFDDDYKNRARAAEAAKMRIKSDLTYRDQTYRDLGLVQPEGGEPPEWELIDCEADPLEPLNVANDPEYSMVFRQLLEQLDAKMAEIGDIPQHDSKAALAGP